MKSTVTATIQGMPVKEIGSIPEGWQDSYAAFSEKRITSVVIPNSVTLIGNRAFMNCTITLPR
ncbi:MAG: leucine-rich repeat domain-containing protein [Treponema sp.]|nr:leucine-rich repeat domain-containing protein [Treponema sp.]